MQNIFGASDSVVQGSVTVNATDVELKNSEYETDDDEAIFSVCGKEVSQLPRSAL